MKIGDKVITMDGPGIVEDVEHYNRIDGGINRWGVRLETQKYHFEVVYYWPKELKSGPEPQGRDEKGRAQ